VRALGEVIGDGDFDGSSVRALGGVAGNGGFVRCSECERWSEVAGNGDFVSVLEPERRRDEAGDGRVSANVWEHEPRAGTPATAGSFGFASRSSGRIGDGGLDRGRGPRCRARASATVSSSDARTDIEIIAPATARPSDLRTDVERARRQRRE
jgi:hypothetical protein